MASLFIVDNEQGWPTAWMILPLLGAWVCIAANNQQSVLSNVVFQKVGLWSYAIYLVHWPFLVFVYALGLAKYSFLWIIPILILGVFLHIFIERKRNYGVKFLIVYLSVAVSLLSAEKLHIYTLFNSNTIEEFEEYGGTVVPEHKELKIGLNEPSFIIYGDSFARELITILNYRGISFISNTHDGCYSIGHHFKINSYNARYSKLCNDGYSKNIAVANRYKSIPIVVLQDWPVYGFNETKHFNKNIDSFHFIDNFESTISPKKYHEFIYDDILKLARDFSDRTIYIVGKKQENPYFGQANTAFNNMLSVWARNYTNLGYLTAKQRDYKINYILKEAVRRINLLRLNGAKLGTLVYVDPDVYCTNDLCDLFINNTYLIYSDRHHYSLAGANKAVTHLLNVMKIDVDTSEDSSFFESIDKINDITYSELEFTVDESNKGTKFVLKE